jgi:hypothetical protein
MRFFEISKVDILVGNRQTRKKNLSVGQLHPKVFPIFFLLQTDKN